MIDKPPENLADLLIVILQSHEQSTAMLAVALADLQTLQAALIALNPDPGFAEKLGKALESNRRTFSENLQKRIAEIALLRTTVSKLVQ